MAIDLQSPLDNLVTMLTGLSVLQAVQKGAPRTWTKRVTAFVTLGAGRVVDKAGGLIQHQQNYFVGFGYAVEGAEDDAEDTLCSAVADFIAAFYAERKTSGSMFASAVLDLSKADEPDYQPVAGQEIRIYPCVVSMTQQANV